MISDATLSLKKLFIKKSWIKSITLLSLIQETSHNADNETPEGENDSTALFMY